MRPHYFLKLALDMCEMAIEAPATTGHSSYGSSSGSQPDLPLTQQLAYSGQEAGLLDPDVADHSDQHLV